MCEGTMGNQAAFNEGTISIEGLGMNLGCSPTGSISAHPEDNRNLRLRLHRVVSGVVQPSRNVVNLAPRRFARPALLSKFPPQLTCQAAEKPVEFARTHATSVVVCIAPDTRSARNRRGGFASIKEQ